MHSCLGMLACRSLLWLCFIYIACSEICELTDDLSNCYKKFLSFEAIGHIHKYLDGDKNGEVDSSEAAKFVRQEFSPSERAQKPRTLTSEDPFVSLTDLWAMWRKNPAFNWTIKQTVQWLTEIVDLPQYEDIFVRHSVDGKALPLLAMQNMSYLTDVLIIRNSIDKKKLMLKALDTILFGPPQRQPLMSVEVSVVTASCGILLLVVFAVSHWFYHNVAVDDRTKSSPDGPASTERALKQLQARLEDLERLRYTLNSCEVNAELDSTSIVSLDTKQSTDMPTSCASQPPSSKLTTSHSSEQGVSLRGTRVLSGMDSLEEPVEEGSDCDQNSIWSSNKLTQSSSAWNLVDLDSYPLSPARRSITFDGCPLPATTELMLWLQVTYEHELQHYRSRKMEAERQLNAARQACKRLHRKRYNILGSVRLLHTDSLDELECKLVEAKMVLEQLQSELHERMDRWSRVEELTGFTLRTNPGLEKIHSILAASNRITPPMPDIVSSSDQSCITHDSQSLTSSLLCCTDNLSLSQPRTNAVQPLADIPEFQARHIESGGRRHPPIPLPQNRSNLPRNYSFVRPFATVWRRKAGTRLSAISKN
ncbi:hypothetical protein P879_03615 [Paragonimus westermani]|uniref:SAM domain-containing protein n=1 Tax=Paragonimus westermani TaxID=34504 RepID=A0A8T0DUG3_9TREM|nr:hypothetical protein P879_03615 [Paragonimus westermani]